MTTIPMTCAGCGAGFEKSKGEVRRQLATNPQRRFYCSLACYGANVVGPGPARNPQGRPQNLRAGNRQDAHSPLRSPARGYMRDNVRFVCVMANLAKANFSDAELVEFCQLVTEYRS